MKTKADCIARIEGLLEMFPDAKIILVSKDVYALLGLKGKSMITSKGKKKLQIADGKALIGVRKQATKLEPLPMDLNPEEEDEENLDGSVDYESVDEE